MTTLFRADLHCHSTCSDGNLTPIELIALAQKLGLQGLAITDHDTVEAYAITASTAQAADIKLLTGVEFSTVHAGQTVHILAYAYAPESAAIHELCQRHRQRRLQRNSAILDCLAQNKMPLTLDDVQKEALPGAMLGRPHIALAMQRKGYISQVREAFQLYIGDHASCYVQGMGISTAETIDIIHSSQAYVVLAHPHLLPAGNLAHELLKMPFDGIEAYYGNLNPAQHKRWLQLAEKHNLFTTGGSDFHGAIRPHVALGCSWTQAPVFEHLYQRFLENASA
jgi:predicted metal-dependent phosphoesterase TrpH